MTYLLALLVALWQLLATPPPAPHTSRAEHRAPVIPAVWIRVAACESSGRWHIDTGNGYYGGLQFAAGTWTAYKDPTDPAYANEATPWRQVVVARRVLQDQGEMAWPVCGPKAHLTRNS